MDAVRVELPVVRFGRMVIGLDGNTVQNGGMDAKAKMRQISDGLYAAWNAHDAAAVAQYYEEDCEIVDVVSGMRTLGRASVREVAADRFVGFPDFSLERRYLVIDGHTIADTWVMYGTQTGEYQGLAPSGRLVAIPGATFTEVGEHGLVVRDSHYVNVVSLLSQLGVD